MKEIKVLIVDDSAVVRQVLGQRLAAEPDIRVIACASDPLFAMDHMKREQPDVIVLDIEMPRMDGITFMKKLMSETPLPVVICSSLTEEGAQVTMEALAAGAVSIVTKPKLGLKRFLEDGSNDIVNAVRAASRANVSRLRTRMAPITPPPSSFSSTSSTRTPSPPPRTPISSRTLPPSSSTASESIRRPLSSTPLIRERNSADVILSLDSHSSMTSTTEKILALGTSTGGTQALEAILTTLPVGCPGLVIVQHMPERFTAAFAQRLNQLSQIEVKEAQSGDRVMPGRALIAPGGKHLLLKRNGAQYQVDVVDGPLVSLHKPSVDVLFRSVAKFAGRNAVGVIMTGMGDDGANGLLEMRKAGAFTLAQSEESCVVFGMPKEAIKRGAARKVVDLSHIPNEMLKIAREGWQADQ